MKKLLTAIALTTSTAAMAADPAEPYVQQVYHAAKQCEMKVILQASDVDEACARAYALAERFNSMYHEGKFEPFTAIDMKRLKKINEAFKFVELSKQEGQ